MRRSHGRPCLPARQRASTEQLQRLQSGLNTINITIYDKSDGQYGWAHPTYICIGTLLTAHPTYICAGTGLTPATSGPELGLSPATSAPELGLTPATSAPELGLSPATSAPELGLSPAASARVLLTPSAALPVLRRPVLSDILSAGAGVMRCRYDSSVFLGMDSLTVNIYTWTLTGSCVGLTPATFAPGLGSPLPHHAWTLPD